eukprot:10869783-Ditylum_brightwellii.AAC.2
MHTSKDQPDTPSTELEELIKNTIMVEIKKMLPSIISTTVQELSQNGLADKTIITSKSNIVSTITDEESAVYETMNTNKLNKSNNDKTTATTSLTQGSTLDTPQLDDYSNADSSSDSESKRNVSYKYYYCQTYKSITDPAL